MSKILIWDIPIPLKANTGGPAGYLYNIKKYLERTPSINNIVFASEISNTKATTNEQEYGNGLKRLYHSLLKKTNKRGFKTLGKTIEFFNYVRAFYQKKKTLPIDMATLNEYDIIHFHSTIHFVNVRHLLYDYRGKTIITTHCPEPYSIEVLSLFFKHKLFVCILKPFFLTKEIEGWKNCDYFIFPVPQAIEVYFKSRALKKCYLERSNKFKFCPSSVTEEICIKGIDIKKTLRIPDDNFIVTYVGRHNKVKGFDQFKLFAKEILEKYEDVHVVVAGQEAPITRLNHPRWHELGSIDYVSDLLQKSDVFVLPNQETYFDLIALEVLRIGTPILMTETGGNKFFKTLPSEEIKGLFFYEYGNIPSQVKSFDKIYNLKNSPTILDIWNNNRALFGKYFTSAKFVKRYNILMDEIIRND